MRYALLASILFLTLYGCREERDSQGVHTKTAGQPVRYAQGFDYHISGDTTVLQIKRPWPGAAKTFTYYLVKSKRANGSDKSIVQVPLESIVVTSTTHIPSMDLLGVSDRLIGFPNLDYISSPTVRNLIDKGGIREIGHNESLNTEVLVEMDPDALVGFALDGVPSAYASLEQTSIPVFYNADWTETHPLGKAEWIKFFGLLFGKQNKADSIFSAIEKQYLEAVDLAKRSKQTPTVLSGALYRDVWYCPAGESWAAQFLNDANAHYLWKDTGGTGSLSLSLESVIEKAQAAEFWIGPGQFTSKKELAEANAVYKRFSAFQKGHVYSFSRRKGPTGGVIYYELAPNRPDLVLLDLIAILHPELVPDHRFQFFDPIE